MKGNETKVIWVDFSRSREQSHRVLPPRDTIFWHAPDSRWLVYEQIMYGVLAAAGFFATINLILNGFAA